MSVESTDLVVVGAGPAGLAAAAVAAGFGARVVVVDESPRPGGRLPSQVHPEVEGLIGFRRRWANGAAKADELHGKALSAGAVIRCGVSVWGVSPGWFVGTAPADPSRGGRALPAGFKARTVLIATGAAQHPLPMPGWTLPGVLTAGAALTLVNVHRVRPGRRVVVVGMDQLGLSAAAVMAAVGVEVKGILLAPAQAAAVPVTPRAAVEALAGPATRSPRPWLARGAQAAMRLAGVVATAAPVGGIPLGGSRLMLRRRVESVDGIDGVEAVRVVSLRHDGSVVAGSEERWPIDAVVTSAGLCPLAELAHACGCPLVHVTGLGGWVPLHGPCMQTTLPGLFVAGSAAGVEPALVAEAQGRLAGLAVAEYLNLTQGPAVAAGLQLAQDGIRRARGVCTPFLPGAESGRAGLESAWDRRPLAGAGA